MPFSVVWGFIIASACVCVCIVLFDLVAYSWFIGAALGVSHLVLAGSACA